MSNKPLHEQLLEAKTSWAQLDRKASRLEEMKKSILASIITNIKAHNPKISVALAEWEALAREEYVKHIEEMTTAREESHIAFAKVEAIRLRIDTEKNMNIQNMVNLKYSNGYGN
jgi:hypothetical protein